MPPENGSVHVECSIMRNIMESATESELGGLFENCQKTAFIPTDLVEMGPPQPPISVENDNTEVNSIMDVTAKKLSNRYDILLHTG